MKKTIFLFVIGAALLGLVACSQNDALTVSDVWARPGLADGNSAVFFTIDNPLGEDDRLLSAASDVAGAVEVHRTIMVDDTMQMQRQDFVAVPAGETLAFKPGDYHVMLIGLHDDLAVGDSFHVTLTFENAGDIPLDVTVQEP